MATSSRFIIGIGIRQTRTLLSGNTKTLNLDFSSGNDFFVLLKRSTTVSATNLPGAALAQTSSLVTEQPSVGFYNITWSSDFLWPRSQLGDRGGPNPNQAENSIDVFSFVTNPDLSQGEKLLGVAALNFY